ncbi:hypothetical protein [Robiginitalea sp. SC105]|uniref:hypothetical protein n=1 Tax=Robiginitalea sp. SC105 TaxID=2762332 RepID=UPI00163B491F|nr:hypothetical protein [Robiginitalea sp. SC105]MBC2839675.1 hypothetical protein [Robiginitalea sp. SC105]
MKKFALGMVSAFFALSLGSCTNDETDPEFDTLTPNEEQTQLHQEPGIEKQDGR